MAIGGGNSVRRKEVFYYTTHSTHFIYGFMASDIWWLGIGGSRWSVVSTGRVRDG